MGLLVFIHIVELQKFLTGVLMQHQVGVGQSSLSNKMDMSCWLSIRMKYTNKLRGSICLIQWMVFEFIKDNCHRKVLASAYIS